MDDLGALRFLVFQLLDLVGDLGLVISTRLDGALGIPDLLQDPAIFFQVLGKRIFLLSQFGQENSQLIGNVRDRIIAGGFAPVGKLRGNGDTLAAGGFVSPDGMVFTLDDLVELLA